MQTYTVIYTSQHYNTNGILCTGKVIFSFGASDNFMAKQFVEMFLTKPVPTNFVSSLKIEILTEDNSIIFQETLF